VFACNAYIDTMAPWALRKSDPARMSGVLGTIVAALRQLAVAITPVTPGAAAGLIALIDSGAEGSPIAAPTAAFPRLELAAVQ
jgi:methionyl-tRNA synthetase